MIRAVRLPALCLALLLGCSGAAAGQLEELRRAGRLDISAGIQPTTGIVPGQRARLTLEIATDRWFTGGTRISIPEVPGLVILQTEQFASNASETRDGQTWVIQRWTLDVFAQRAGSFTIPPIALQLQVNADEQGDIQGQTFSPQTRMDVTLPDSL